MMYSLTGRKDRQLLIQEEPKPRMKAMNKQRKGTDQTRRAGTTDRTEYEFHISQ